MYTILVNNELFCDSRVDDLAIISPTVTRELNKAGSFNFVIPPNHPYYDMIERKKSIIEVYRDEETEPIFAGMAVNISDDFYKQRSVECEGELSFFNDTIQRPARYQGVTIRQLLEAYINVHNSLCESSKRFEVGQVTVEDPNDSVYCYTNYDSTMKSLKEDLIDDYGGYLRVRHANGRRYLDYLAESPHTSSQIIRLGENLLNFKSSLDATEIATVVIPLGATLDEADRTSSAVQGLDERVTIKSVNNNKDYLVSSEAVSNFGWIEQVVTFDGVTSPSILKTKGERYLSETQFENMTIEANALDLHMDNSSVESFKLFDLIRVISTPHGLDRYFMLTKITYNLNTPERDTITLGVEEKKSLSASSKEANAEIMKKVEQVPTSDAVQSAINNATALLKGVDGGYIRIITNDDGQPTEIRIQDALDSPTKVWRWNLNGLGYSSDGGNTYGTAITMNGAIVADYITSGTMSANRLRGGTLSLGGANNVNGQAYIYNASGTQYGTWNNAGLIVGSPSAYQIKLKTDGSIVGSSSNVDVGSIKYDASHTWTIEGTTNTYKGVTIKSDDIKLESTLLDITAEYVNVKKNDATYYYGTSGTFTAVTSMTYSYVDNVVADLNFYDQSWNNTRIPYVSNYQTKGLYFHKGLMTTSL